MTARPPRDVRADAKRALARWLHNTGAPHPDALAGELLVVLDGIRIGLTDTTRPADPNADYHRPDPNQIAPAATPKPPPGLAEYLAARGKTTTDTTTQEGQPQ